SYLVRTSLARVAQWMDALGTLPMPPPEAAAAHVAALIERLSVDSETPQGRLTHLASPLRLA
ncbi:MAG: hypothetical protein JWP52_2034, partial [Rhizobacter sp.]|nr:hypothetical protein [Rhizobacter sp.]